jgi:alkyldihydroxyacetonephosphate synthase
LCFVDPGGEVRRTALKLSSYQPWCLDPWLVGSEGTLGVLVSASLFMRPVAAQRWYRGFVFPDVPSGVVAIRQILRSGLRPSVLRLYDEFDTMMAAKTDSTDEPVEELVQERLSASGSPLWKRWRDRSLRTLVSRAGVMNRLVALLPKECLLVVVQEGEPEEIECAASLLPAICKKKGAKDLGEGPGRHWWKHRYAVSYKQSWLFQAGVFVDTMEVATTWDRLLPLYHAVRAAASPIAFVMAHFSHAYRDGCSIYFSFAAASRKAEDAPALYDRLWEAAQSACLAQGAAVSHHHGVGYSKQRYLVRQLGQASALAAAVKKVMDPAAVFNPAKLGQNEMRGLP